MSLYIQSASPQVDINIDSYRKTDNRMVLSTLRTILSATGPDDNMLLFEGNMCLTLSVKHGLGGFSGWGELVKN